MEVIWQQAGCHVSGVVDESFHVQRTIVATSCERETETERDRKTERDRETETDRQKETEREIDTEKETEIETKMLTITGIGFVISNPIPGDKLPIKKPHLLILPKT